MIGRARLRPAAALLIVVVVCGLGCRSAGAPGWSPTGASGEGAASGERVEPDSGWVEILARASEREAFGDLEGAAAKIEAALAVPGLDEGGRVWLALRLQDLEERSLSARPAPAPGPTAGEDSAQTVLRVRYAQRARGSERALDWLLAARAEEDDLAALHLLGRALEFDGSFAWAHYGRAHVLLRLGGLEESRQALDRALALEPGHIPARRLEVRWLERQGRSRDALAALDAWLQRTATDPRVAEPQRVAARIDAAALSLEGEGEQAALARLAALGPLEGAQRERALLLQAVALDGLGRSEEALAAARAAQGGGEGGMLAWMHEALLLERRLGDPAGARRAWLQVLAAVGEGSAERDLDGVLAVLRARFALARLESAGAP